MSGRVIIQDTKTRCYLGQGCSWVQSCQEARVFEHTYTALLEGLEHRDKTLQVVWCFQHPEQNLYVAVRPGDEAHIQPCTACKLVAPAAKRSALLA